MRVGLYIGNLWDAPADVVCTSTNPQLSAFKGSDSALRKHGGQELREASAAILTREEARTGHRQLPVGSAAATGPGELPYQAVVHCVSYDAQGANAEGIENCLRNAWDTVLGLKPRPARVALPVLAADNGKFDAAAALRIIADTLKDLEKLPIESVWIVLKDATHQAAAQRVLTPHFGAIEVRTAEG